METPTSVKPRVYIETTIPSFYHSVRSEPDMIARRDWTRQWWDGQRDDFEMYTSGAVIDELQEGEYPNQQECLDFVADLPLLEADDAVDEIVQTYVNRRLMPANPKGDALHLAVASLHRCDFLVTWNCHHLANANKYDHIRRVNSMLNLFVPTMVTPMELLAEELP